jgi:hypothetical protein
LEGHLAPWRVPLVAVATQKIGMNVHPCAYGRNSVDCTLLCLVHWAVFIREQLNWHWLQLAVPGMQHEQKTTPPEFGFRLLEDYRKGINP